MWALFHRHDHTPRGLLNRYRDMLGAARDGYSDQQAIDSTTPMGRAMIQMASVFGEQERQIISSRVNAGLDRVRHQGKKLGRPKVDPKIEGTIRQHLGAGHGILKVAKIVGVGSGTVQRVKREMADAA